MAYISPVTNFVKRDPYALMRPSSAPTATGGKAQPRSPHGPSLKPKKVTVRKVKVKAPKAPTIPKAPAGVTENALLEAAVRSRFAPQEQALGQQLQQNARYSSGTGDWYAQALKEIQGLKAQGQQSAQQTLQGIQSYTSQPTLPNATDQQAATARNNLNAEFASSFGQQANANSGAMDRLAAALLTQQGNSQSQANVDRQRLLQAQGGLGQEKADFKLTYGAQQQAAQSKALTDQAKLELAAQALGLKVKTYENVQKPLAKSLAGDRTNKQKVARTNARTQRKNAQTNAAAQALGVAKEARQAYLDAHPELKKGKKGAGGRTAGETTAHHKIIRDVDNATDDVSRGKKSGLSDAAIRGAMKLNKIPNDVIDAAFARAGGKPLTASQINRLRNAGLIAAPRKWKQGKPSLGQLVVKGLQGLGK